MLAFAMPAALSRSDVEAIAALAHLELAPAEVEQFTRQLGDILHYADQVQRIDTTGVPPPATVAVDDDAARADEARPSIDRGDAVANAPDAAREAGLFRVPRVIG